jgi:hypothetical protein
MRFLTQILFIASTLRPYPCFPTPGQFKEGYKPPRDLADGVHYVPTMSSPMPMSGNQMPRFGDAVQIANITNSRHRRGETGADTGTNITDVAPGSVIGHLPITYFRCQAWDMLDMEHYRLASAAFAQRCDKGEKIPKASIMFAKYGSAIVYGCSFGGRNPCSTHEMEMFDAYLDLKCGHAIVGYTDMKGWEKRYGRSDFESRLCKIKLSQ